MNVSLDNQVVSAGLAETVRDALGLLKLLLQSDTFWTAVSAVGTVIALYLIYRQIASARDVSAYEFLRREDDRFESDEMKRVRSKLARLLMSSPAMYDEMDQYAEKVCDYFEDLGLLLRKGITPEYFTWTMFSDYIINYWELLSKYIDHNRTKWNEPTYYSEFQHLYRRMVRIEIKTTNIKTFQLTREDTREFLERELHLDIRHFALIDLPRLMEIEQSAFALDAYPEQQFHELHKQHPGGFFVAEMFEELVGYVIGYVEDGVGQIDSMAVDGEFRRLGIARCLVEHIVAHLKKHNPGLRACSLEVRTTNEAAIGLYEKLGFRRSQTLQGYYADAGDAFVMTKHEL